MSVDRLSKLLDVSCLSHWYQPVIDLSTGESMGYEALLRYEGEEKIAPVDIFNRVGNAGFLTELDCLLIKKALNHESSYTDTLFINALPSTLLNQDFIKIWDENYDKRMSVVLEICENEQIREWDALKKVIQQLKARQVMIAIDDFGAGHSFFRQWIELEPDFIKIDQYFTKNLSYDTKKQEVIKHLIMLLKEDTKLILEGIETLEALQTALDLGLCYGQGYYLGHPMPWNKRSSYSKN